MLNQVTQPVDLIGAIIGFLLTIVILSYVIGDNILFRMAISIFIGVASGYAAVLVIYNVLWYKVLVPAYQLVTGGQSGNLGTYVIRVIPAVILGIWMMVKISPRLARVGTPVLAFLTGVGAATVIAGAVRGTIFPQIGASINLLNIQIAPPELSKLVGWFINGLIILVGTITTLIYFQFGVKPQDEGALSQRSAIMEYLATAGQGFIVVALGVLFAGVYIASLSALIDRVRFLWEVITRIF
jgi:hypothetical protein